MTTLSKLLQEGKELNISRCNMKSKENLQKSIKVTRVKYEVVVFGNENPT